MSMKAPLESAADRGPTANVPEPLATGLLDVEHGEPLAQKVCTCTIWAAINRVPPLTEAENCASIYPVVVEKQKKQPEL